uniref:Uncharacterized protein n=3 Tax=Rhodosorus marinus TaxID=101924 RepID=A0A7S3EJI7_9RHOD|mmetsp:Transcript_37610/g.150003  ORF Transcript_37610/g.150003 Transcript_37610/m.150003 type:complete len:320 (+) Transcript_37610:311-1270(+)
MILNSRSGRVSRIQPAVIPVVPIAGGTVGVLTLLWLLKARILSVVASVLSGTNIRVKRVAIGRDPLGSFVISLRENTLKDNQKREALKISAVDLSLSRKSEKLTADVVVSGPEISLYFENYALTKNNWRSILTEAQGTAGDSSADERKDLPVEIDPSKDGHVQAGKFDVQTVTLRGGLHLEAFSVPLDNASLFRQVDMSDVVVRPSDFQSLERTVQFVEHLTAKALLTLDAKKFPESIRKPALNYAREIFRQEGSEYVDYGRVKIRQLDSTLDDLDRQYGSILGTEATVSVYFFPFFFRCWSNAFVMSTYPARFETSCL